MASGRTSASKKAWILPLGMLGFAIALSGIVRKPTRPRKAAKKEVSPLPSDEEIPPEPWEVAAAAVGDVGDEDTPTSMPEDMKGSGSPEEHCLYDIEDLDAQGLGSDDDDASFCVTKPLEDPEFAPDARGAPMAPVPNQSTWPLQTKHRRRLVTSYLSGGGWRGDSGRSFAASRNDRNHSGVDLFAEVGDAVLAPEDGVVFRVYPFKSPTWALYLWTHDDRIINLGEIKKNSWREFGVRPGDHVKKGQALARIGLQDDGAHMLHLEIYDVAGMAEDAVEKNIRSGHYRWIEGDPRPAGLTDPTSYLIMAGTRTYQAEQGIPNSN